MKINIAELLSKVISIFLKKSESGEKSQEIQEKKLDLFRVCLVNTFYVLLALVVANSIFPKLQLSDWIYSLLEKILNYMMA
ncbi:MAG: hypothetical protein ACRC54_04950 [Fusobacteriaceae bacterium]